MAYNFVDNHHIFYILINIQRSFFLAFYSFKLVKLLSLVEGNVRNGHMDMGYEEIYLQLDEGHILKM